MCSLNYCVLCSVFSLLLLLLTQYNIYVYRIWIFPVINGMHGHEHPWSGHETGDITWPRMVKIVVQIYVEANVR